MAKKFRIILLGKGYNWKTDDLPKTEGRKYTFTAKTKLEGVKGRKKREHVLDAGANTDVLIIKFEEEDEDKDEDEDEDED